MMDRSDFDAMTPLQMARALMVDHPASCKVGYSPANAALAAQSVYSLTNDETDELRQQLTDEHDLFEQLGELATRENSEKLLALDRAEATGVLVGQILFLCGGDRTVAVEYARRVYLVVNSCPPGGSHDSALFGAAFRALETLAELPDDELAP